MNRLVPAKQQIKATEPGASNWVGANAGSGKTHVLTERVARLLLAGAAPQKILCLTYTKAAAAEMQTRLFQKLGGWAMESETILGQRLADMAGQSDPVQDPDRLAEARRLFARALETPGGLKIQTIHAFCESLLRRFPLEAGISPRFEVADDRQSALLRSGVRTDLGLAAEEGSDTALDRAARLLNEGGLDQLSDAILGKRAPYGIRDLDARLLAHFGTVAFDNDIDIARRAVARLNTSELDLLASLIETAGGAKIQPVATAIRAHLPRPADDPVSLTSALGNSLLRKSDGAPRKDLLTKAIRAADTSVDARIEALSDWVQDTLNDMRAARMARRTSDLYAFAGSLLSRLNAAKAGRGLLDFDDLVARAESLLTERHMRAWVLYKLDLGIDHILVDEAQDTSPQQWEVVRAIAEEFFAGEGAREGARSLFVVGDEKQSIYSFQGAEPQAFGAMRAHFSERLEALGTALGRPDLRTSYRSAPALLNYVDAVFSGPASAGLTLGGATVLHDAHRKADQGRVDLWPLVEADDKVDQPHWTAPVDTVSAGHPKERLAKAVSNRIAAMVGTERRPARKGEPGALVTPGDILVLVRKRDLLARGIIQGLKAHGVPVAGADRLSLSAELAIKDLLALARVSLMPSDDLSLAVLLRSPICGLSEQALFDLAHNRPGTLLAALDAAPEHANIAAFLRDMANRADYVRPYEFFAHALIAHDARRRLVARLGPEAEDPIDELLDQALAFEQREIPSLAGFIAWIDAADIEIKREMDQGAGQVRVMTIHGAKGLEAPIVILPDTVHTSSGGAGRPKLLPAPQGGNAPELMLWAGAKAEDDRVTRAARDAAEAREDAEGKRLLYVALTRAEDWLILCGAQPGNRKDADGTWYDLLAAGFRELEKGGAGLVSLPSPTGTGEMQRFETGPAAALPAPASPVPVVTMATSAVLPDWVAPATFIHQPERGVPSALVDQSEERQGGTGLGRDLARRRGTGVHLLLERFGTPGAQALADLAPATLARLLSALPVDIHEEIRSEALRVLEMPEAAELFGPASQEEVTVAIDPPHAGPRMIGRIDRLVVRPDEVLIVDFKTDAAGGDTGQPPSRGYLAQLGAYAAGLRPAWPDHTIGLAVLWTAGPTLQMIDPDLADEVYRTSVYARYAGS